MRSAFIIFWLGPALLFAQSNEVPYNSKGNSIALTVENTATVTAKDVIVEMQSSPAWLVLESPTSLLKNIPSKGSKDAEFRFSVEKSAPVGKEEKLIAVIKTSDGQLWTKEITFKIGAPKDYHLYDNFPNPFNPSTKIAFELPITSKVKVVIFDAIGRAIRTVTDEEHRAGYIELSWDGKNDNGLSVSSGVYFFQASTPNWHSIRKMILIR